MSDTLRKLYVAYKETEARLQALERARAEGIAIIGLGCRFPGGANDPAAFWELLAAGRDAITDVPAGRWDRARWLDADPDAPGKTYTALGGYLDGPVDEFDAAFFNIAPREARALDPQQRLLLEVCWEAFEHAGLDASGLKGSRTGVFVGLSGDDYALAHRHSPRPETIDAYALTGTTPSTAAGRLSYVFGLEGPCLALDTACSSSLVAIHLACRSLRAGESNLAVAGGVNLILTPDSHVCFSKLHAISPDGRCRTFDAAANGYARGEGCGLVVLKRLSDALADGDRVLAVVRGTAMNQDGRSNGLTAPNGRAQRSVIRQALADAGIAPERVSYLEAHGTGTPLGDPVEMEAIAEELAATRDPARPLHVGSVKTNVGHLESAAGMAGLIKIVLALAHDTIPAHLHFREPSPYIPWSTLAVRVPAAATPWPRSAEPRVAGVSAFGFSGTNAHVVLEDAPPATPPAAREARPVNVLALSAQTPAALAALAARHARTLRDDPDADLAEVCASAAVGRAPLPCRLAVVAAARDDVAPALERHAGGEPAPISGDTRDAGGAGVAFLFTGQGSPYPGMAQALYAHEPVFRRAVDECDAILATPLGRSIAALITDDAVSPEALSQTLHAQPAIFTLEYALVRLWQAWGVRPAAVLGHSVGEYVAAWAAGVFSLEDALGLVAERGRLMQALTAPGAMTVLFTGEAEVRGAVGARRSEVSIAAVNGPALTVISGARAAVDAVVTDLAARGVKSRPLAVSHAFHSPLMAPMVGDFERAARRVTYRAPDRPVISNLTGALAGAEIATPEYWSRHVLEPVRFADGLARLRERGISLFVELGARPDLLAMAPGVLGPDAVLLPSLRPRAGLGPITQAVATLWTRGVTVDWRAFHGPHRRVALPTYPFQRQRYWALDPGPPHPAPGPRPAGQPDEAPVNDSVAPSAGDALIDREFRSPLADSVFFETVFDRGRQPFLDDHRVYGETVVSGAALVALLLHAAARLDGPGRAIEAGGPGDAAPSTVIEDLVFHRALVIPARGRPLVQLAVAAAPGRRELTLISLDPADPSDRGTVHATGVLSVPSPDEAATSGPPATPRGQREIPAAAVYDLQRRRGIELGPSYRWLETIRVGDGEAVGHLVAPSIPVGLSGYRLHPGLIDSCFAVLVTAGAPALDDDTTLVPAGLRRFRLVAPPSGARLHAHAQVRHRSAGGLTGDVRLYDEAGALVAEIIGLEGRRTERGAFLGDTAAARATADWLYTIDWRRAPLSGPATARSFVAPRELAPSLTAALDARVASPETAAYGRAMRAIDDVCLRYVRRALADLGVAWRSGDRFTAEAAAERAGVIDRHRRLWRRLLGMLGEAGDLRRIGAEWQVITALTAADPTPAMAVTDDAADLAHDALDAAEGDGAAHLALAEAEREALPAEREAVAAEREVLAGEHEDLAAAAERELALVRRCGQALARVLRGECDALNELLFPGGDLSAAAAIYRDAHAARVMNDVLAGAVTAALARVPAHCGVRVLEIGAGTGGCTASVLAALAARPAPASYVFTDVSPRFTAAARDAFAAHPFVTYERLDVERDPEAQGFAPHAFDVVIAANVLHATADLGATLAHVRRLLAPGGLLLLMEGTAPARWLDLTFGLTDGWWRFADARGDHPLISTDRWEAALRAHGFDDTLAVTTPPEHRHAVAQQAVILARADQTMASASANAPWLIFSDDALGATLAPQLNGPSVIVTPGNACQQLDARTWTVDPSVPEHFTNLLDALIRPADPPLRGIVYAWRSSAGSAGATRHVPGGDTHAASENVKKCRSDPELASAGFAGAILPWGEAGRSEPQASDDRRKGGEAPLRVSWLGALHLVQALARRRLDEPPRVWLVTRGAISAAGEPLPGLADAPLWGLGATLAVEHPELTPTLIDLDAGDAAAAPAEAITAALADEIAAASPEPRVALRRDGRHVARLTRASAPSAPALVLPADRTYLIAGGLGDLGAAVARRLAERGAHHLALVGRREPSDFAREQIGAIEAAGGRVRVLRADVTDGAQMAAALAEVDRDLPPLAGVVHAAGTLDNARLIDLDAARFARVLAPKVEGALHLHRLTAGRALDFFVMFASAASLLGAHGQANHAAANAFLDALAHHRRANGWPGLSLDWGAWSQIGAAARGGSMLPRGGGMLRVKGVGTIAPARGLDVLEALLHADGPQIGVIPIDWPEFLEQVGAAPLLSDFERSAAPGAAPAGAILAELAATPVPARPGRLHAHVVAQVAAVLALPPAAAIHPRQGFFEMGMDSLTSVELRNRLQGSLGCALPPTVAIDFPSVEALVDHLVPLVLARLPGRAAEPPGDAPGELSQASGWTTARPGATIPEITDELARLTEAEAERLLLQELAKLNL